jgi:hypothetical protein
VRVRETRNKRILKVTEENKAFNETQDYSHITDPYFKRKLDDGHIKYLPEEWTVLDDMEENELR